jgi:hypothetical protein
MLNCCRIAAGLIAVWLILIGILSIWPDSQPGDRHMQVVHIEGAAQTLRAGPEHGYVHTGLWVADMHTDGTVVYLRQIKRR